MLSFAKLIDRLVKSRSQSKLGTGSDMHRQVFQESHNSRSTSERASNGMGQTSSTSSSQKVFQCNSLSQKGAHYSLSSPDKRNQNSNAPVGSLGPGAEPPVAVASRAFAHERLGDPLEGCRELGNAAGKCSNQKMKKDKGTINVDEGAVEYKLWKVDGQHVTGTKPNDFSSLGSSHDDEEAETLPDCFEFSNQVGPEGVSTEHHGEASLSYDSPPTPKGDHSDHERKFIPGSIFTDVDDKTGHERTEHSEGDSLPPTPECEYRARKIDRQRLFTVSCPTRIAPYESDPSDDNKARHRKHVKSRRRIYGPPPRRRPGGTATGQRRLRRRRKRLSTPESDIPHWGQHFAREVPRLRWENDALKCLREDVGYTQRCVRCSFVIVVAALTQMF